MSNVYFTIPGMLPSLNQMLKQAQRSPYAYNKLKQDAEAIVFLAIRRAGIRELAWPIRLEVDVYAPDRRTDCDNLQAGVSKFCLDALVSAGCLPDDGWKHWQMPEPFRYRFYVDKTNPRIEVKIFEKNSGKRVDILAGLGYNIIVGEPKPTNEKGEPKMTNIDRWALESYERWYLEPEEPTDWEAEEEAFWNECDRRYEEERDERLGG